MKRRHAALTLSAAAGVLVATLVGSSPASQAQESAFTCRASAARVEAPPGNVVAEPVVANAQDEPCTTENRDLLGTGPIDLAGFGTIRILYADTCAPGTGCTGPTSQAGVASVTINTIPGATTAPITAELLTSQANAECVAGQPTLTGSSTVATVSAEGQTLLDVTQPTTIDLLGLGTLTINEQTTTADTLTQRALHLNIPGVVDIVIAESVVDFTGNPCGPTTTTTVEATTTTTMGPTTTTTAPPAKRCNAGRGNGSEPTPPADCDPGRSGGHNRGGD